MWTMERRDQLPLRFGFSKRKRICGSFRFRLTVLLRSSAVCIEIDVTVFVLNMPGGNLYKIEEMSIICMAAYPEYDDAMVTSKDALGFLN